MTLGQKLQALRDLEALCRGRDRALSKADTVKLIHEELGEKISLAYLSQLETGKRVHMTNKTRLLLARFFRVLPGYLVDDPADFQQHLTTPTLAAPDSFASWLRAGAVQLRDDPLVSRTLERLAAEPDPQRAFRLLGLVLATPGLMDRLLITLDTGRR